MMPIQTDVFSLALVASRYGHVSASLPSCKVSFWMINCNDAWTEADDFEGYTAPKSKPFKALFLRMVSWYFLVTFKSLTRTRTD